MNLFYVLIIFVVKHFALSFEEIQIISCNKDDSECFNELVKQFMKNAVDGIPEHNVDPLDPLKIASIDFETLKDITFHLSDVNITGLKNVEIVDTKLHLNKQITEIKLKLDMMIKANMAIEFTAINKSISNINYRAKTNPLTMTTEYRFDVSPNSEGVEYFIVNNNETTKCEITRDAMVNLDAVDLDHILREEPDLQEQIINLNEKGSTVWKNQLICKIAEETISRLMDNFRIACRIMPASKYIRDTRI